MSIATLGDVQLTSEDVDTLDEWLNDQVCGGNAGEKDRGFFFFRSPFLFLL